MIDVTKCLEESIVSIWGRLRPGWGNTAKLHKAELYNAMESNSYPCGV